MNDNIATLTNYRSITREQPICVGQLLSESPKEAEDSSVEPKKEVIAGGYAGIYIGGERIGERFVPYSPLKGWYVNLKNNFLELFD